MDGVELAHGLRVDTAPGDARVVAHVQSTVVAQHQTLRKVRVDPQCVVIHMHALVIGIA